MNAAARAELEHLLTRLGVVLDDNMDDFETDWHGYTGEAYAALLAALGDPIGAAHPRRKVK